MERKDKMKRRWSLESRRERKKVVEKFLSGGAAALSLSGTR